MSSGLSFLHLRLCVVTTVALFLTTIGWPLASRAQNPNGALRGEVLDATGARIPGATVAVLSSASAQVREMKADEHGEFRIEGLVPGAYRLTVTAAGFAQASARVEVVVSTVR